MFGPVFGPVRVLVAVASGAVLRVLMSMGILASRRAYMMTGEHVSRAALAPISE